MNKTLSEDWNIDSSYEITELSDLEVQNLSALAKVRGESAEQTFAKFQHPKAIQRMPKNLSPHAVGPLHAQFSSLSIEGDSAYLTLPNGRVFCSFATEAKGGHQWEYLKDLVSPCLTAESWRAAREAASRYVNDWSWYEESLLPSKGGVIVEVGAYLGHKTIKFIE